MASEVAPAQPTDGLPSRRPPAHAWDWFARQRLPWREVRSRLAGASSEVARRYQLIEDRTDVLPALREDYPFDPTVRDVVHRVIAEVVFLDRIDRPFADLGARNAPRGMRWWWEAITGEVAAAPVRPVPAMAQPTLPQILEGYGD